MDAATTNKVLKNMNPSKVLSNMRKMRRKRLVASSNARSATTSRKVQFDDCETTMTAQAVHYYDRTDPHCMTAEEQQQERWYSQKELHAIFLKDLEEHLRDQVASTGTSSKTDGRGLEEYLAHNNHQPKRQDQVKRCVKAIVDKSHAIRKQATSSYSHPIMKAVRRKSYADIWAEDLSEYITAAPYTIMSRDWALEQAALDEAQAKAVYCDESIITRASLRMSNKQGSTSSMAGSSISITHQGPVPQLQEGCVTAFVPLTAKSA
jgi:hypothetical protein